MSTKRVAAAWAVALGFGCGAALKGWAAPPAARDVSFGSHQGTHVAPATLRPGLASAGGAQSLREGTGTLDLRPPDTLTAVQARSKAPGPALRDPEEGSYQNRVASIAGLSVPMHESSRLQEFAQRVKQEGVPVARLFESRSALLSLGLNQRGKPGLWLIQKTH